MDMRRNGCVWRKRMVERTKLEGRGWSVCEYAKEWMCMERGRVVYDVRGRRVECLRGEGGVHVTMGGNGCG